MTKSLKRITILISWLLILTFGTEQLCSAAPLLPQTPIKRIQRQPTDFIVKNPSHIDIPFEYASLRAIHKGTNGKLIIHIQDAHANYSGQRNMARILDYLMNRYDISLVLSEGGEGDATLGSIRSKMAKDDLEHAAGRLLLNGMIAGHEYLNLTSDHGMQIVGVENRVLYDQNLEAYAALSEKRKVILTYLHRIQNALDRLIQKHFPRELLRYEQLDKQKNVKGAYVEKLDLLLGDSKKLKMNIGLYPELSKLLEIRKKEEDIDFSKSADEQAKLFKALSKKGDSQIAHDFLADSKRLKGLKSSQYVLLNRVFSAVKRKGVSMDGFAELLKYRNYLRDYSELKMEQLLGELETLQNEIALELLQTDDSKILYGIYRYVNLLKKAYQIQMTSKEHELFTSNAPDFPTDAWQGFLNERLAKLAYYDEMIPFKEDLDETESDIRDFYALVNQRDEVFIRNSNRVLKEQKQEAAFLITGGYHTSHLQELLREEGYSYVVLTPLVTSETDQEKYEENLLAPVRYAKKEAARKLFAQNPKNRSNTLSALLAAEPGSEHRLESHKTRYPQDFDLINYLSMLREAESAAVVSGTRLPKIDLTRGQRIFVELSSNESHELILGKLPIEFQKRDDDKGILFAEFNFSAGVGDWIAFKRDRKKDDVLSVKATGGGWSTDLVDDSFTDWLETVSYLPVVEGSELWFVINCFQRTPIKNISNVLCCSSLMHKFNLIRRKSLKRIIRQICAPNRSDREVEVGINRQSIIYIIKRWIFG